MPGSLLLDLEPPQEKTETIQRLAVSERLTKDAVPIEDDIVKTQVS
jgi:hypothetical protein